MRPFISLSRVGGSSCLPHVAFEAVGGGGGGVAAHGKGRCSGVPPGKVPRFMTCQGQKFFCETHLLSSSLWSVIRQAYSPGPLGGWRWAGDRQERCLEAPESLHLPPWPLPARLRPREAPAPAQQLHFITSSVVVPGSCLTRAWVMRLC